MTDTTTGRTDVVGEGQAWQQTACILCECNCGIEVRLGGDGGRHFERIRGDKAHPASQGYTCEKALRLDHYQNAEGRLTAPLRRRADGTFERIDWDTAITEIAAKLAEIRDSHGGGSIFYYGGGGQGNHLGGAHSGATLRALGAKYRSSALAQEKTGEFWVNNQLMGTSVRGDFEHCEVALFVGKNPWHSHGIPRARTTLKEIARDPERCLIVVDPRRTETAELADIHLQVRPGTDAWLLAAMAAAMLQDGLVDRAWLTEHSTGLDEVAGVLRNLSVDELCGVAGVEPALVRTAVERIAGAASVAVFEDLGVQMSLHSTLSSYLEKLVWLLAGQLARPGAQYAPSSLVPLIRPERAGALPTSPVVGAPIITGLVPCNVIPDEILTDHPDRYRAMLVESGNPAHSLADSPRMREALSALELLVVIDVAFTETARLAHYVLPAPTQYEKWEATFFNFDFPRNVFHLRKPVLSAPEGVLPEPEIHARLVEALGALPKDVVDELRAAAERGRGAFAEAFFAATAADPDLGKVAPVLLYRTLGPSLPDGAAAAAVLWGAAHRCAQANPSGVQRAGFTGDGLEPGERLFDAILEGRSGVVITDDEPEVTWQRLRTDDGRVHLAIAELLPEVAALAHTTPDRDPDFPFVLSAGERRSFTANTIFRDPAWRKRDAGGALRIHPDDAARVGVAEGGRVRVTTQGGSTEATVELNDTMQPGHVALPNGLGLSYRAGEGEVVTGVAPNELTSGTHRDPWAGTPYHKHVPARLEAVEV